MACNPLHSAQTTADGIHIAYAFSYANAAARTGATGFVAADVGKFARQTDDDSIWMLTSTAPTWILIGGGSGADITVNVSANDTTPGFLNGKLVAGTNVTFVENNDGGNETLTISANDTGLDDQVTEIQLVLDGYALLAIEDQRWSDSSQQRQDIRDALDGYVLQGDFNDLDEQVTNIQNALDGYSTTDENVKVSANDTTVGYLNGKLIAGTNVTLVENNDGGNETFTISANDTGLDDQVTDIQNSLDGYALQSDLDILDEQVTDIQNSLDGYSTTDENVKVSANDTTAGYLNGKLIAGTNVTLIENNDGGNETLTISANDTGLDQQVTDIQLSLDGYALESVEDQRWVDSSEQRQDIRDALDGYITSNDGYNVFGNHFSFADADGLSTTTYTTYVQKLTHNVSGLDAGTYILEWYAEARAYVDPDGAVDVRIQEDNSIIHGEVRMFTGSSTFDRFNDFMVFSGHKILTNFSGTHDFDIDYRNHPDGDTGTVGIRRARITIWRVS